MAKSADAFRTISEVAEWLETPAHVLRFWESKFSQVKPVKRAGGRRYYRPADMQLLGGIKQLLHEDGMTIKGVQKILRENGVKHVAKLSQPLDEVTEIEASEMAVDVTPDDEAPGTAEVVSFRGGETRRAPAPNETPSAPSESTAPTAPPEAEPEPEPEIEPSPEAEEAPQGAALGADDQPETKADRDETLAPPVMPSFLQRSEQQAAKSSVAAPETKSAEPASPTLTAPDIPDDPSDDTPAEPGPLSAMARLSGNVDPDALAQMRELADQLGSGPA